MPSPSSSSYSVNPFYQHICFLKVSGHSYSLNRSCSLLHLDIGPSPLRSRVNDVFSTRYCESSLTCLPLPTRTRPITSPRTLPLSNMLSSSRPLLLALQHHSKALVVFAMVSVLLIFWKDIIISSVNSISLSSVKDQLYRKPKSSDSIANRTLGVLC